MEESLLLLVAGALFVLTHLGFSSRSVRSTLVEVLGENGFLGFYTLISFATLGYMIYQYGQIAHATVLWPSSVVTATLAKLIMPIAIVFVVLGVTAKNPTAVKQEAALDVEPAGVLRITRHPVQWAILLWAGSHLISNGDLASVVFLIPFVIVSAFGTIALDRKKSRSLDPVKWEAYLAKTSNVPFAAIIAGRNRFVFSELGSMKIVISIILTVFLIYTHEWIAGVALYDL